MFLKLLFVLLCCVWFVFSLMFLMFASLVDSLGLLWLLLYGNVLCCL